MNTIFTTKGLKLLLVVVVVLALGASLVACGGKDGGDDKANTSSKTITSPDDFEGAKVAVQTGTTASDSLAKLTKKQKISVSEYEKIGQCFDDLKLGRIDAVYVDNVVASYFIKDSKDFEISWTSSESEPMAVCFRKDDVSLEAAVAAATDTLYFNGKMKEIAEKNFGADYTVARTVDAEPTIPKDFTTLTQGKLTIGAEMGYPPMEYTTDDGKDFVGFDIDYANELGKLLGVEVAFVNTSFDGIFAGLEKKQYDCIISGISVTPERQEKYLLSKPYVANALSIVVLKAK